MTAKSTKPTTKELSDADLDQVIDAGIIKIEKPNSLLAHVLTHLTQQTSVSAKNNTK